jgi:phenylpyruvate tautomerase PptA (4-oxalocrotonate tautomerase family)
MPIVDITLIGEARAAPTLCDDLAQEIGRAIGAAEGSLWVTLTQRPASDSAENGPPPQLLPVFARVLARGKDAARRVTWAQAIAGAVAATLERPLDRVHVIFEPDADGRVFFGGR